MERLRSFLTTGRKNKIMLFFNSLPKYGIIAIKINNYTGNGYQRRQGCQNTSFSFLCIKSPEITNKMPKISVATYKNANQSYTEDFNTCPTIFLFDIVLE